jgi:outer membrane protein TolC
MQPRSRYWPLLFIAGSVLGCVHHAVPDIAFPPPQATLLPCPQLPVPAVTTKDPAPHLSTPQEVIPIDFVTALRLADQKNSKIAIARERIQQALASQEAAEALWLPNIEVGPEYAVHDNRIQQSTGDVIQAHRSSVFVAGAPSLVLNPGEGYYSVLAAKQITTATQARAEGVTNELLLQVALTYLDLLEVYAGLEINTETLHNAQVLVDLTASFERSGKGVAADSARARVELFTRQRERYELEARLSAVSAHLTQLLRLAPEVTLKPAELNIPRWNLVSVAQPVRELVAQALLQRPELAENRALITAALERWRAAKVLPLVPSLRLTYAGGLFGGGPDGIIDNWGGRGDFSATFSWQLAGLGFGDQARIRERQSLYAQTVFQQDSLEARVAEEVVAAQQQVLAREKEFQPTRDAVVAAQESYRLNEERIRRAPEQGRPIELLQAIQALAQVRQNQLQLLTDYDRAQFRLFAALGYPLTCAPGKPSEKE